jgi:outer membrane protein
MKRICQAMFLVVAMVAAGAIAQPLKIGVVNGLRIENESESTKRAIEQLKKEFAPREQQLQELQKQGRELRAELERDADKLKPPERQLKEKRLAALSQQFEQQQRSFAEDMEFRQREVRMRIIGEINAVITAIADAEKFDLIVQQAIYTSSEIDLTDRVIKEMAKRAGAAPR